MAITYTASITSGYATNTLYYDEGPLHVFTGHYSSPSNATGIIETGMYNLTNYYVQDADVTTFKQSANANVIKITIGNVYCICDREYVEQALATLAQGDEIIKWTAPTLLS